MAALFKGNLQHPFLAGFEEDKVSFVVSQLWIGIGQPSLLNEQPRMRRPPRDSETKESIGWQNNISQTKERHLS